MTQMQLADELHIANKARLSNYENGRREVPLEVVILMAEYFHTSTDYILRAFRRRKITACRKLWKYWQRWIRKGEEQRWSICGL
jgi:transcriptional regulator with XRE-family HTH domain